MNNIGLVLEGGGMRGLYTCGVLEYFMEKDLYFNYIIGVSAGASNAASYISKQKGRNIKVNTGFLKDWRYMSFRSLVLKKSFFGMDFIFKDIPDKYVEFDYETFHNAPCEFLVGVTDCKTGKPLYFNKKDIRSEGFDVLRASCSLPLMSPIVNLKGYELLDGGISDSIPITKSIKDGNDKNIIILTRNKDYRKSPLKFANLIKMKYKKYPLLIETMMNRHKKYNDTLDYIERLEEEGKAIVIRASKELKVDRLEKDPVKLQELFQNGYEDAQNAYKRIMEFIR
ncbi:patatin-like phospholipase family protein [Clostridium aciditolerans]|uniref:Patatin family protein n=1 Tax=Clostridium aciditolerans TaxID=339861 RepID=A0A934M5A8_9CLOT|nr:patatin family protein [Clostridium aciditolerans]MBI6871831.1 patatin family protein [Clostridium aciditolerans]